MNNILLPLCLSLIKQKIILTFVNPLFLFVYRIYSHYQCFSSYSPSLSIHLVCIHRHQIPSTDNTDQGISDVIQIECNSNNIMVTLNSPNFNGMIYPKGLSKNSTCMVEYTHVDSVTYLLPLRSCNTMSADVVSVLPPFTLLLSICQSVCLSVVHSILP